MAITPASSRMFVVGTKDDGTILEMGPASTTSGVGTFVFQFNPDLTWQGALYVMARLTGAAAAAANLPFLPVPYRRVTVNNVASDYAFVSDAITGATKIHIPSNMDSIGFLVDCDAGSLTIIGWDLLGPSAP